MVAVETAVERSVSEIDASRKLERILEAILSILEVKNVLLPQLAEIHVVTNLKVRSSVFFFWIHRELATHKEFRLIYTGTSYIYAFRKISRHSSGDLQLPTPKTSSNTSPLKATRWGCSSTLEDKKIILGVINETQLGWF